MTDNEKIEELLKNYRSIKSNVRTEAIQKIPEYSLPAVDYSNMTPGESNGIFSKVEDYVVKHEAENSDIRKLIKVRDIIRTCYESLTIEKKHVIKYVYFEGLKQIQAGFRLEKSENTIGDWKWEALEDLKKNGILRAWKFWKEAKNESKL